MPIADVEKRKEVQRLKKRAQRAAAKLAILSPHSASAAPPRRQATPGNAVVLSALTKDLTQISHENWPARRVALGERILQRVDSAMEQIEIRTSNECAKLYALAVTLIDQGLHQLPVEDTSEADRSGMIAAHRQVLASPEGRAAQQTLTLLYANQVRAQNGLPPIEVRRPPAIQIPTQGQESPED